MPSFNERFNWEPNLPSSKFSAHCEVVSLYNLTASHSLVLLICDTSLLWCFELGIRCRIVTLDTKNPTFSFQALNLHLQFQHQNWENYTKQLGRSRWAHFEQALPLVKCNSEAVWILCVIHHKIQSTEIQTKTAFRGLLLFWKAYVFRVNKQIV